MRARRNLGAGIASLLTDRERLGVAVAGLSVAALGIYSAREGTRVAGRAFDRRVPQFLVPAYCCIVGGKRTGEADVQAGADVAVGSQGL